MPLPTDPILQKARRRGDAVGAFNVYSLEGIRAMVQPLREKGLRWIRRQGRLYRFPSIYHSQLNGRNP